MTVKATKEGDAWTTYTKVVPVNAIAYCSSSPTLYFHPDSETIISLDACDGDLLEQEHNRLSLLLAARVDAQQRIEILTTEAGKIGWGGLTERERYQYLLKQEYQKLDEAVIALRHELADLTPASALVQATLLDENAKKSAIGITELIEIRGSEYRGGKYTYVRSDKIRSHWRRYRLNDGEKKTNSRSFITTVSHTGEDGVTRTRQTVDMDKLKSQLAKIKPSMTLWEQKLIDDHVDVLACWAEELNESLKKHAESGSGNMVFDSQAQLLRWTYGAGLKGCLNPFEYDIRTRQRKPTATVSGKLSAYASMALAEGKSTAKVYWPDHAGVRICYPLDPERIPGGGIGVLGTLRFDFELALSGTIGASLGIEAGVGFSGDTVKGLPVKAVATGIPGYWRQVDISKAAEDAKSGAELSLFAGAEAGANLGGKLVWLNPDKDGRGSEQFSTLAKVATGVAAQAGWGVSGCVELSWKDGKVRIRVKGGLCSGMGAKGSVTLEVDGRAIMTEFMPCLVYMLRNADYTRLMAIMTEDDYNYFCAIPLLVGMYGLNRVIDAGISLKTELKQGWDDKEARVALMENILAKDDCMKFAPPESKGAVIASLIETSFWDGVASPASHRAEACEGSTTFASRKRAILNVLRWVQSKREHENVMQHLSKNIGKKDDWKMNEARVLAFLGQGEEPLEYGYDGMFVPGAQKVIITPSHYAENLHAIYDWLPDAPAVPAGHPNMSEWRLTEVPLRYIHSCTRYITTQHGR
ncbi:hypothetical protein PMPD1_1988 [Paramixta manurensis]|uniref:Uncharacterized protein n=1 Tax=Paramixta manurensis TaxID=2740817 RepID=A0A6M8UEN2_9GAMM|nr:hypothetical protein PMPD1_1988 [Erwiniaceae bacterium PD-1]